MTGKEHLLSLKNGWERATGAYSRWKWADYYIPKEYALTSEWLTKYKGPLPFGPDSIPSIGMRHAIQINHEISKYGALDGSPVNEREMFANNFKKDLNGAPARQKRKELMKDAGKRYNSGDPNPARIGYSPGSGDDPPLSNGLLNQITRADVNAHCAYFKTRITQPLTQAQFDALASISFNMGGRFKTMIKVIIPAINRGDCEAAAKAMLVDPLSETEQEAVLFGKTEKEKRRTREAALFATGEYDGGTAPANLIRHLNEQRRAAAEIFLNSKGAIKPWVGKTEWFSGGGGSTVETVSTAAGTNPDSRVNAPYNSQPGPPMPGSTKQEIGKSPPPPGTATT